MEKVNNYPRVTQVLKSVGIIDFSKVPADLLDRALKFGTAVHKATELDDKKNLNESVLDPNLKPYLDAWRSFKEATGFQIESIEEKVISQRYRYQGTLDRRGIIYKRRAVVDIKTSVDFHPGTSLQLAAYQGAFNETAKDKIRDRYAVILKEDRTYKIMKYTDDNDFNVFLACLSLTNWKEKNI